MTNRFDPNPSDPVTLSHAGSSIWIIHPKGAKSYRSNQANEDEAIEKHRSSICRQNSRHRHGETLHPHQNIEARGRLLKLRRPIVFLVPLQPLPTSRNTETRDGVDVEDGVNVEDGLNVDGGVNSSSRLEEPYIGKLFEDVEDVQAFYKAYARRYEVAIDARYFKEKEKDVRTKSTCVILKTPLKIEENAAFIYIRKSFMIFQDELLDSLRYISRKLSKKGESKKYGVTSYGKDTLVYHVTLESGEDVTTCTCHKWEFIGILCKHILCVFGKKGQVRVGLDEPMMRKSKSIIQFYDIVKLGMQSQEKHNHLTHALQKVHKELIALEDHVET
ncbi:hypothetical protein QYF36_024640 [Acer negundo]|nr:hypothetical protein QYF36_024640 [Acer negundo]